MQILIYAVLLSFAICMGLGPLVIPALRRLKLGQQVRSDGPQTHLIKAGTPTMGGVIIFAGVIITSLALTRGSTELLVPSLLVAIAYGLVGFADDFIKIRLQRSLGLKAYQKILGQVGIAVVTALFCYNHPQIGSKLIVPFLGTELDLGVWYIPFCVFVIIALVNSVNLTDGLDGLASSVTLIYSAAMALVYYAFMSAAQAAGQVLQASNLQGMLIFCGATVGACLGFLRFNSYPAQVFMGDTGSMVLGGAVTMMALMNRGALLIPIMGGCFVASAASVVLQVGSYKLRKKRIFKMAPLHHHFELKGYPETRVVAMYMIITTLLCLLGLLAVIVEPGSGG